MATVVTAMASVKVTVRIIAAVTFEFMSFVIEDHTIIIKLEKLSFYFPS
jgi:hypothetical protein